LVVSFDSSHSTRSGTVHRCGTSERKKNGDADVMGCGRRARYQRDGVRGVDPAVRYLMNTPASWFDFGMSQLRYTFDNIMHV